MSEIILDSEKKENMEDTPIEKQEENDELSIDFLDSFLENEAKTLESNKQEAYEFADSLNKAENCKKQGNDLAEKIMNICKDMFTGGKNCKEACFSITKETINFIDKDPYINEQLKPTINPNLQELFNDTLKGASTFIDDLAEKEKINPEKKAEKEESSEEKKKAEKEESSEGKKKAEKEESSEEKNKAEKEESSEEKNKEKKLHPKNNIDKMCNIIDQIFKGLDPSSDEGFFEKVNAMIDTEFSKIFEQKEPEEQITPEEQTPDICKKISESLAFKNNAGDTFEFPISSGNKHVHKNESLINFNINFNF